MAGERKRFQHCSWSKEKNRCETWKGWTEANAICARGGFTKTVMSCQSSVGDIEDRIEREWGQYTKLPAQALEEEVQVVKVGSYRTERKLSKCHWEECTDSTGAGGFVFAIRDFGWRRANLKKGVKLVSTFNAYRISNMNLERKLKKKKPTITEILREYSWLKVVAQNLITEKKVLKRSW